MTDSVDYIRAGIVGVAVKTFLCGENGEKYCRGCDEIGNEETLQESDTPCEGCGTDICIECNNVCAACDRGLLPLETLASAFLAAAKEKKMTAAAYALELGVIPKLPVPIKRRHGDREEEDGSDEEEEAEDDASATRKRKADDVLAVEPAAKEAVRE